MENDIFPWNPISKTVTHSNETVISNESLHIKLLNKSKAFLPYVFILGFLAILYGITRKSEMAPPSQDFSNASVEIFTPLFPIQKGEPVPLESLRILPVRKSLFSKAQLLQLMNAENVQVLKGRLVAKKALFPNKPLFWNDLELKKAHKENIPVQIIYSN